MVRGCLGRLVSCHEWLPPLLVAASSGDTSSRGVGRAFLKKTDVFCIYWIKEALFVVVKIYVYAGVNVIVRSRCAGSVPCIESNTSSVTCLCIVLPWSDIVRGCAGAAQFSLSKWEVGLGGRGSGWEAYGVRKSPARSWNIPVTAADTRVGDADVSERSEGGVTTPLLIGDTRPFWVDVWSSIRELPGEGQWGWVDSGVRIRGFPGRRGFPRKVLPARKNLPARKRLPTRKIFCRRCGNSFGGD